MCSPKTAGILIVGDEILKGRVVDTNSTFIVRRFYNLGIRVRKISVLPDDVDVIAKEVSAFSKEYDFVITTGGIGPTHDDVTYAGIAKAFNEKLIINNELKEWVISFSSEKSSDLLENPAIRMARIPKSARLLYAKKGSCKNFLDDMPVVYIANVYVFPGIPSYFQHLFVKLESIFKSNDKHKSIFFDQCLYLNVNEMNILGPLNSAVEKYHDVTFGSYPVLGESTFVTKITLESSKKYQVWDAEKYLISLLPKKCVVKKDTLHIDDIMSSIYEGVFNLQKNELVEKVKMSIQVIEECLKKYDFSEVCISFNGGKDCTALLHLTCAVLWQTSPELRVKPLQALYICYDDPIPEVDLFITESVKRYNLDLNIIPGPIKNALASILKQKPNLRAVLMGTRRTDPYSDSLTSFQMTDPDWPQVLRVSPILDWSYEDIWMFLRKLQIPYCNLYDRGYTSLGSHQNTVPNPRLSYTDDNGQMKYRPAYLLEDEKSERSGRH